MTTLEAFDTVKWAQTLVERLQAAADDLERKPGFKDEKAWLDSAVERVRKASGAADDLRNRVLRLPELDSAREDHAATLQQAAVDAVERLQAGITFHTGSRTPLLETLFGKLKLPAYRRADKEDFEQFIADFEKKLSSGYSKRMLSEPQFAFAAPVVDDVRAAFAAWAAAFAVDPLPPGDEQALRDELEAVARELEMPLRQARLLAEAALTPLKDAFEASGIGQRPKRRVAKTAAEAPVVPPEEAEAKTKRARA